MARILLAAILAVSFGAVFVVAQTQVKAQIARTLAPVKKQVDAKAAEVGAAVEQGVGRALSRLGVPSKADIEELTHRVSALSRQLRAATK